MNRRTSEDPGDRAGIDDAAIPARPHDACRLAGKSEAGGEIGGKDPLQIAILPFRERAAMLNSCIVDEDIELAMPVDDIGDGRPGRPWHRKHRRPRIRRWLSWLRRFAVF